MCAQTHLVKGTLRTSSAYATQVRANVWYMIVRGHEVVQTNSYDQKGYSTFSVGVCACHWLSLPARHSVRQAERTEPLQISGA